MSIGHGLPFTATSVWTCLPRGTGSCRSGDRMSLAVTRPVPQGACRPRAAGAEAGHPPRRVLPEQALHPWECPAHLPPRAPLARARGQDPTVREKAVLMKTLALAVCSGACPAGPGAGVQGPACCRLVGRALRTSARQGLARLSCRGAQALGTIPGPGRRPRCLLLTPWRPPRWTAPPGPAPHPREPLFRLELC